MNPFHRQPEPETPGAGTAQASPSTRQRATDQGHA